MPRQLSVQLYLCALVDIHTDKSHLGTLRHKVQRTVHLVSQSQNKLVIECHVVFLNAAEDIS